MSQATWRLLCLFALSIPFSIALAQALFAALVVAAAVHWLANGRPRVETPLDRPMTFFVAAALLAALVGLDVRQGLWGLRTYLQLLIVPIVYLHVRTEERALRLVRLFLWGMIVTSAHTLLATISPWPVPNPFPGQMTESGQLLFAIGLTAGLWLYGVPGGSPLALALHSLALLANLKRGVWLGAAALIVALSLLRPRRAFLGALALLALLLVALPPLRSRIQNTTRDLFLPGNRYDIWTAAVDVIQRFPMGVGRKNGTILRDYPNIPKNHKHAHNNFLQITMEHGFLGLIAFLWWMGAFAWVAWRGVRDLPPEAIVGRAVVTAALASFAGFHVAGLVEYNFGDTEVLEIFFLVMGLAIAVREMLPVRRAAPGDV